MEGENNRAIVKIDIHGKIKCTAQDGQREYLLEGNLEEKREAELWFDQVKRRHESKKYKDRETSAGVSIYRVPESIKKTKRGAYDPLVVFLGPYHHKKHQQLTEMDDYKLKAVDKTLERLAMTQHSQLHSEVKKLEKDIKNCYEDSVFECDGDTLTWMMTMDACFILEFLRMELPNSSLIFHFQRVDNIKRREIILDILKLENQIPLCVLRKILELETKDSAAARDLLAKLLFRCNGKYFQGYPFSSKSGEKDITRHIEDHPLHLLDLSRRLIADFLSNVSATPDKCSSGDAGCVASTCIAGPNGVTCFTGASWNLPPQDNVRNQIPSAEKLQRAGIKLKLSPEGKFEFKRRCFLHSTLLLSQITVEDYTEIFLRNLVAFEECQRHDNSPVKRVISLYMYIMDNLIDSQEDVGLFQRANIIDNYLGTGNEVAKIFNDLCFGITYKEDFKDVLKDVNEHYKSLNVWITELRKEHCSSPWYVVSFVAAILLLVMTLLQTIYTMESYFRS